MVVGRDAIGSGVEDFVSDVFDADGVAIVDDVFGIALSRLFHRRSRSRFIRIDVVQQSFQ